MSIKKKLVLIVAGMLAATSVMASAAPAKEQTSTIPVTLTVVNTINAIDVTLPASFPITVSDGKALTATNINIRNNSTSNGIEVAAVSVTNGAYTVGNYDAFSSEDKGKIALCLNNCKTTGAGSLAINKTAFPIIKAGESLPVSYSAKVAATGAVNKLNAANIIFTLRSVPNA